MKDILLVEDHVELAELIALFLEKDGYRVEWKVSSEEALEYLSGHKVRLLLLDVMLPGMDGFAFCAEVRKKSDIPIIMMSAMAEKEDKLSGFVQGADDYLEKPVDVDILRAKIKALMRRNYERRKENAILCSGALRIDTDAKRVFLKEKELILTVKEYELLMLFVKNPGKTLHKDYLFDQIWGIDSFSENQTLTVHIKMLRDKLEEDVKKPERIKTVWGVGYRYEEI